MHIPHHNAQSIENIIKRSPRHTMMSLEDNFQDTLQQWKRHIRSNSISSNWKDYLQCRAYERLVGMGEAILPLVRQELSREMEADDTYGSAKSIEEGNPGALWAFLLHRINPEYTLPIEPEGSGAPVEQAGTGSTGIDLHGVDDHQVMRTTLRWLEKYVT